MPGFAAMVRVSRPSLCLTNQPKINILNPISKLWKLYHTSISPLMAVRWFVFFSPFIFHNKGAQLFDYKSPFSNRVCNGI